MISDVSAWFCYFRFLRNTYPSFSKTYSNPGVWVITRQRAWQIRKNLGIMNHTQRHWRATQLADAMDPFTLKEALHRATMPFEYVHRAESQRLEHEEETDEI